ncbi:Hybrid signal transduction histidine kinase K [Sphaceloma murrayae]|uniref:Hybrid signal transduction histidine kinase K n=1 Tax=Sphaceloma murrayae TaxID=2082308 RepID=A0A2K1QWG5_9PEZI|nr:Hybrid signal transduction histidine kinase K [Sphaceloma murrayae]
MSSRNLPLPIEVQAILDFVTRDDRPTLIVQSSSRLSARFLDDALDRLLEQAQQSKELDAWVEQLTLSGDWDCASANAGSFCNRRWLGYRILDDWFAVYCMGGDWDLEAHSKEHRQSKVQAFDHVDEHEGVHESLEGDIPGRPTDRLCARLEDRIVDWFQYPGLTKDPWVHLFVNHPWETTAIGPMCDWPSALHQTLSIIVASSEPRALYWGNDLCMFYNEAAKFLVGPMHPDPLGNPLGQIWGPVMLAELTATLISGLNQGKPLHNKGRELVINRHGYDERTYWNFVFLPIPSPTGHFLGFINEFHEVTSKVMEDNRTRILRDVLKNASLAEDLQGLCTGALKALHGHSMDVSYALLYSSGKAAGDKTTADTIRKNTSLSLQASFGVETHVFGSSIPLSLVEATGNEFKEITVLQSKNGTLTSNLVVTVDNATVDVVCLLPISSGDNNSAIIVLGMNPKLPFDQSSRGFLSSLHDLLFRSATLHSLTAVERQNQEYTLALTHQLQILQVKAEKSANDFTAMVSNAPIGMCLIRADGFVAYANEMFSDLLNATVNHLGGFAQTDCPLREAVHENDVHIVTTKWTDMLKDAKALQLEFRTRTSPTASSAPASWVELTTLQQFDKDGKVIYVNVWLTDISARKASELLIAQRLEDALETKRTSENFIDMVSHEIRNPLSSILQLAEGLSYSPPPFGLEPGTAAANTEWRNSIVHSAETIILCAKHQKNIVDEVLTYSKLDSDLVVIAPEPVQPIAIAYSALEMLKADLNHADIQGSVVVDQSYKYHGIDFVLLDQGRFLQVIINLMTNAIKFTQQSNTRKITIDLAASPTVPKGRSHNAIEFVEPHPQREGHQRRNPLFGSDGQHDHEKLYLQVTVKDTGCGLTKEELRNLFQRFSQASPRTYKTYGGSGLGLFISRKLTELHGGQIGVYSESGVGSEFCFYIQVARTDPSISTEDRPARKPSSASWRDKLNFGPVAPSARAEAEARFRVWSKEVHILLVEDNAVNQRVMTQQLRKLGCGSITVADNGVHALEHLSPKIPAKPGDGTASPIPSLILMDVEMPLMDGLTASRHIRQLQKEGKLTQRLPIIGVTANARIDQISACLEAGMDRVVTKPFRILDLMQEIEAVLVT